MSLSLSAKKYLLENFLSMKELISKKTVDMDVDKYYVKYLDDNLYKPMSADTSSQYHKGSGKELICKMRAVYSSSAFAYNFFGNDVIVVKNSNNDFEPGPYSVCFEKQLKTLNKTTPANLDVLLTSDKEYIFIEVKCTEWLTNKNSSLSKSYTNPTKYMDNGTHEIFSRFAAKIFDLEANVNSNSKANKGYPSNFKIYDAAQMFKHTLGIYNFCIATNESHVPGIPKKIRLVNFIWEPKNINNIIRLKERKQKHAEEFKLFHDAFINSGIQQAFVEKGFDFDILEKSLPDMLNIIEHNEEQRNFLSRYE